MCFDVGFLGDMARLLQCLHHTYVWELYGTFLKMVARPIVVRNNFQEGFRHYTDQNTPYKR